MKTALPGSLADVTFSAVSGQKSIAFRFKRSAAVSVSTAVSVSACEVDCRQVPKVRAQNSRIISRLS